MTSTIDLQTTSMSLEQLLDARRAVRGYLPDPVDEALLRRIFETAQRAPSNCNTQPWQTYVVSSEVRDRLSSALVETVKAGTPPELDFGFFHQFADQYRERQVTCAADLYENMGIARDDKAGRFKGVLRNQQFFDAPHAAFIGMPKQFDTVNAIDVGCYLQTLMLTMTSHGIACCAQLALSFYPQVLRSILDIPDDIGVLVGISFGYEDVEVPANATRTDRASVRDVVRFYD
jgi:hypothetical protein